MIETLFRLLQQNKIDTFVDCLTSLKSSPETSNISETRSLENTLLHIVVASGWKKRSEWSAEDAAKLKDTEAECERSSYLDAMKALVDCGIDVNTKNTFEYSALDLAVFKRDIAAVSVILGSPTLTKETTESALEKNDKKGTTHERVRKMMDAVLSRRSSFPIPYENFSVASASDEEKSTKLAEEINALLLGKATGVIRPEAAPLLQKSQSMLK